MVAPTAESAVGVSPLIIRQEYEAMTISSEKSKTTPLRRSGYDDFTVIRGIGQTRQQWLRETFDVYTFADLAALSAEAIEAQFKAEKKVIARSEIEGWLREAQKRASVNNPERETSSPNENWRTLATFEIVFEEQTAQDGSVLRRTTVHHMEADETRTWPQIEQPGLLSWMMTRLGTLEDAQNDAATAPSSPIEGVFSARLEQMIAKAQMLTHRSASTPAADTGSVKSVMAAKMQPPEDQETLVNSISPRLRQVIAKVRSLEEGKQR